MDDCRNRDYTPNSTLGFFAEMKMTLRTFFTTLLAALGLMGLAATSSAEAPKTADVELLFVQSATSGSYDGKTLTLNGVPSTTYFSDRPKRIVGHLKTGSFVEQWAQGKDSFAGDPPNAVLSILGKDGASDATVELSSPRFEGDRLSYQVKLLDGTPPKNFNTAALFIDGHGGAFIGGMVAGSIIHNMRR
jgi:hypothetical protein